jgi:hexulose-6-phosphate isomerase
MSLRECLQLARDAGFDGIELNYDLESELSPKSGASEFQAIRKMAEEIGIAISGLCSFLYWPYSLTDNDVARRARALELASRMIEAAHDLGTENLLTIAGSTYIPWLPDREPVPIGVCAQRARESIGKLLPRAEKLGVYLNFENIVFNGYLTTPDEMNAFVDSFASKHVRVHFDTGNVMIFQFPEHWIPILGGRIRNVHFQGVLEEGDRPHA